MSEIKYVNSRVDTGALKIIACICMLIDHVGAILYPNEMWLRAVGRIAFPIFCYLIVEGYVHTRNVRKYAIRLFIFALISEIPFDLAFNNRLLYFKSQNVFFTLFIGLIAIYVQNKLEDRICLRYLVILLLVIVAALLMTDYSSIGVLIILFMYVYRGSRVKSIFVVAILMIFGFGAFELYGLLAFIPLGIYNGKKQIRVKYFFYAFYPVHLLVLYFIASCVNS